MKRWTSQSPTNSDVFVLFFHYLQCSFLLCIPTHEVNGSTQDVTEELLCFRRIYRNPDGPCSCCAGSTVHLSESAQTLWPYSVSKQQQIHSEIRVTQKKQDRSNCWEFGSLAVKHLQQGGKEYGSRVWGTSVQPGLGLDLRVWWKHTRAERTGHNRRQNTQTNLRHAHQVMIFPRC